MGLGGMSPYSDAAHRCSDIINQLVTDGQGGRWCAIRLSDGGSDKIPYDTRQEAIDHQLHEMQCCYVLIPFDGMSPKSAESFMRTNRMLYDAGMRLSDPEREIHIPHATADALRQRGIIQ